MTDCDVDVDLDDGTGPPMPDDNRNHGDEDVDPTKVPRQQEDDTVPGTQFSREDDVDDDQDDETHVEEGSPSRPSARNPPREPMEPSTPLPSRGRRPLDSGAEASRNGDGDDGEAHFPETPGVVAGTPFRRPVKRRNAGDDGDGDKDEEEEREEQPANESVRSRSRRSIAGGGGGRSAARSIASELPSVLSSVGGGSAGGAHGNGGDDAPQDDENHDDDNPGSGQGGEEGGDDTTVIRGTDVHVQTAAAAFRDFIRNFVSVEESERVLAREARRLARRKRARAAAGGGAGGGGGGDDDGDGDGDANNGNGEGENNSLFPSDSEDEDDERDNNNDPKIPIYLQKLEQILLRGHSSPTPDSLTSATAFTGTGRLGVSSLDLDALHLYFHSPACQRLYSWLIDYPAEIVPLMDILLGRELESLRDTLRLRQEERLADAEARNDTLEIEAASSLLELLPSPSATLPRIQVRPFHLRTLSHMRSLDPNSIDNLLSLRGMVVRTSPVIPDLKVAFFHCSICGETDQVTIDRGRIDEPTQCPTCQVRHGYTMVHNRCYFSDKQMVRVQETPDEVPAGETPASIVVFAYDDLVDAVRPGDRVEVTGVFRAQARRVNPKITKVKSVYRTYVDAIHFRKVVGKGIGGENGSNDAPSNSNFVNGDNGNNNDSNRNGNGQNGPQQPSGRGVRGDEIKHSSRFSPQRIAQLEELSRQPDVYDRLVQALAPSIWEMEDVKKGVLCMLFGGNSRKVKKGTAARRKNREKLRRERMERVRDGLEEDAHEWSGNEDEEDEEEEFQLNKRGDINILLVGDPGTSKSQLLGYVHKLSPRGVYTSGKGSSAVGLTASVVRDPETRELVMESGALVLSDLGICCIDEFDKMSGTTRAILHEAMEQQTVSIAKAGIIATLNARTSILASANPVESRYNPSLSVVENIQLPPTLLSRFDLIYLILDSPSIENDRMLAQHLVGLYYETPDVVEPPMDHSLLRDYIAYARENIHPELSDNASRELIAAYLEMRRMGNSGSGGRGRTISATPRQLESLIRISESLARMRYSRVVTHRDVQEAVRLMKVATQSAATDPRTGRIDMDMINTGRSTVERELEETLGASLKELLAERRGNRMSVSEIRRQLNEILNVNVQQDDLLECLRTMEADGLVQFNERAQTVFVRAGVIA